MLLRLALLDQDWCELKIKIKIWKSVGFRLGLKTKMKRKSKIKIRLRSQDNRYEEGYRFKSLQAMKIVSLSRSSNQSNFTAISHPKH